MGGLLGGGGGGGGAKGMLPPPPPSQIIGGPGLWTTMSMDNNVERTQKLKNEQSIALTEYQFTIYMVDGNHRTWMGTQYPIQVGAGKTRAMAMLKTNILYYTKHTISNYWFMTLLLNYLCKMGYFR